MAKKKTRSAKKTKVASKKGRSASGKSKASKIRKLKSWLARSRHSKKKKRR